MQMFPWEKQILKCELDFDNIQIYDVPKNIDLEINGWGSGKFTNNQYFEKNSSKGRSQSPGSITVQRSGKNATEIMV